METITVLHYRNALVHELRSNLCCHNRGPHALLPHEVTALYQVWERKWGEERRRHSFSNPRPEWRYGSGLTLSRCIASSPAPSHADNGIHLVLLQKLSNLLLNLGMGQDVTSWGTVLGHGSSSAFLTSPPCCVQLSVFERTTFAWASSLAKRSSDATHCEGREG